MNIQAIDNSPIVKNLQTSIRLQTANNAYLQNQQMSALQQSLPTQDFFEKTNKKHLSSGAKAGIIFGAIAIGIGAILTFKSRPNKAVEEITENIIHELDFREKLAQGLSKHLGKEIEAESLSCVVNKNEFIDIISNLKKENFVLTHENIEKGIFRADLHSHSNFSDGSGEVRKLLDEAAEYGNKLYEKTQTKFTYALTDHDGVDGVIEALTHISENPQKFKNIRFVPGAELSYAQISPKSANPTETNEVLAYCIDPFSEKVQSYFNNLYAKRSSAMKNTIEELNKMFPETKFSTEEFQKIYRIDLNKDMYRANLHWQVHHYGQTKLAISNLAKESGQNSEALYSDIMSKTDKFKALGNLKDKGLIPPQINENMEIIKLREHIQPKIISDNLINAQTESTIEEIVNSLTDEKEIVFALAHPYYLTERIKTPTDFIKSIIGKFKGKLIGTESYHQAYSNKISKKAINEINSNIEELGLIPLGGRDNHSAKLF